MIENWSLLEGAFQSVHGIDLEEVRDKSWRWFHHRLMYILQHENPFSRALIPREG